MNLFVLLRIPIPREAKFRDTNVFTNCGHDSQDFFSGRIQPHLQLWIMKFIDYILSVSMLVVGTILCCDA